MTYQQSLELAELEADTAEKRFLEAFQTNEHPEVLAHLKTESTITRRKYYAAYNADLAL